MSVWVWEVPQVWSRLGYPALAWLGGWRRKEWLEIWSCPDPAGIWGVLGGHCCAWLWVSLVLGVQLCRRGDPSLLKGGGTGSDAPVLQDVGFLFLCRGRARLLPWYFPY